MTDPTTTAMSATGADLPPEVAAALAQPVSGTLGTVDADDRTWATIAWGDGGDPPVLLLHGVTSNAGIWWRVAPAIAASGRRVVALDMPGHGRTQGWSGRHRFEATAGEVASFIRAAELDRADLAIVGHSWGAMVTAYLPSAGVRPATLVLLDPPALTLGRLKTLTEQPTEVKYETLEDATAAVRAANPAWSDGDVSAKAQALIEFNAELVLAALLRNGSWDAGMAALRRPEARGIPAWLIRGEWDTGGFIPDSKVPELRTQLGDNRVITIAGGPHSPQRTHPEATILAILTALGGSAAVR